MDMLPETHPLGCMIAAAAMVLDLTYEQVSEQVPLQDAAALERTGRNWLGLTGLDNIELLALEHGKRVSRFPCKTIHSETRSTLHRYDLQPDPLITHVVAIDESGVVFDPDPAKEQSRENWETYDFMAVLEFCPL